MNSTRTDSELERPPLLREFERKGTLGQTRPGHLSRLALAVGLVVVAIVAGILFCFDPAHSSFYPHCLFHQITGLNCPGCGATRALHELLHGQIVAALHSNALLMLALPFVFWLTAQFLIRHWRWQPTAQWDIRPSWLGIFLTALVVFTVLRNLPACAWLSP